MQNSLTRPSRWARPLSLLAVFVASAAAACQVPVFRYALERWPADKYEIVVLHDGPLSDADRSRFATFRQANQSSTSPANFDVRSVDVAENKDEWLAGVWKEHGQSGDPLMAVLYPRNAREVPDRFVQALPFSDPSIKSLVDSPVRRQIAKHLIEGDSAVWIFVPCGDAKQDAAARAVLTEQIALNEKQLELPPQDEIESDEAFLAENEIELRIGFSMVTLNRDDPQERVLLKLLLASEPDLEELDQPMAFPVLGRGRVLYALVGRGIAPDTIGIASRFIVGPCSCQVKEQNPGFDLLLAFDWDEKIAGSTLSDPLPLTPDQPVLLTIPPGKAKR